MRTILPVLAAAAMLSAAPAWAQTAGSSPPAAAPAGASVAIVQVDVTKVAQGVRLSRIIDEDVENEAGEEIGEVDDLIFVPGENKLYAVIGVGGFLGMGERNVVVPYDALKPKPNDDDLILAGATKDQLKQMPEFKYRER